MVHTTFARRAPAAWPASMASSRQMERYASALTQAGLLVYAGGCNEWTLSGWYRSHEAGCPMLTRVARTDRYTCRAGLRQPPPSKNPAAAWKANPSTSAEPALFPRRYPQIEASRHD